MNHLALEQAVKSALAASAFPTTTIYTGTGYDTLEPQTTNLIVSSETARQQGVGLYVADVTVRLTAPALQGGDSYAAYVAQLTTLRDALTPGYMATHWPTTGDAPAYFGLWLQTSSTTTDGNNWVSDHTLLIGVGI
jgi:hypothetical protein